MIRQVLLLLLVAVATLAFPPSSETDDAPVVDNTGSWDGDVVCNSIRSCREYWLSVARDYYNYYRFNDDDNNNNNNNNNNRARRRDNSDSSSSSSSSEESGRRRRRSVDSDDDSKSIDNDIRFYKRPSLDTPAAANKKNHRDFQSISKYNTQYDKFPESDILDWKFEDFKRMYPRSYWKDLVQRERDMWRSSRRGQRVLPPWIRRKVDCNTKSTEAPKVIRPTKPTAETSRNPCIKYSKWLRVFKVTPPVRSTTTTTGKQTAQPTTTTTTTTTTEEPSTEYISTTEFDIKPVIT